MVYRLYVILFIPPWRKALKMTIIEFVSVGTVARRYEVSNATVWRWSQNNQIPKPVKINGSTRWRLSELEQWENQQITMS